MAILSKIQKSRLEYLEASISGSLKKTRSQIEERRLCDNFREVVRLYKDVTSSNPIPDKDIQHLLPLAKQAITYLGGEGDLSSVSLKDYDHKKYGPYLGVSDEGSAAEAIRIATLSSPKAMALKNCSPMTVGTAVDAERLGGIGEVAVGPEEYVNVRLECMGRILSSTNVGTRVNLRFYRRHPVVTILRGETKAAIDQATNDIRLKFEPFLNAPGNKPRPLTVFIEFEEGSKRSPDNRIYIIRQLSENAKRITTDSSIHRLGYQVRIGSGKRGREAAIKALDVAKATGIKEVAIHGETRKQADENVSYPGLLNYMAPGMLGPVLRHANGLGIHIKPVNRVDPDTVARHIWSALHAARQMGYELGKYGLFPLTLEESDVVVRQIHAWFPDWTPAPVFFVDQGLLSELRVDTHGDLIRGLKSWLQMAAKNKVRVVLIDTIEKARKVNLLRLPGESNGLMSVKQLAETDRFAANLGIKALWAGGITFPQVYVLGKLGVFGIYVTTAASSPVPVPPEYEADPWLAAVKEPTFEGVLRTKLLLEAGFLNARLRNLDVSRSLDKAALDLIAAFQKQDEQGLAKHQEILSNLLVKAWHEFIKNKYGDKQ